ncbi:VOC family protein [Vagococcus elongatus]|uniref:VOC domain-containing protein n=1 Tax=Vagococcus elongatus TaxID=180344 RepID=A0A430B4H6_9ENTE|nr:VOC family protein [Vagococcus elongatus]RSU15225.1 hypothetical protein CBF29_02510 [Vagococcus elongatus]
MKSLGLHHVSSLVSDSHVSYDFYHNILGLKLLMKTVNQDDTSMYHLFFSDMAGRPGTEFTVFQINTFKQNTFGTNAIERTIFGVPNREALDYWEKRLDDYSIEHWGIEQYGDSNILRFEDPDGLKLGFSVLRQPEHEFLPNTSSDIPADYAVAGIHSIHLRVRYPKATQNILEQWFDFFFSQEIPDPRFPVTVLTNKNSVFQHEVHLIEDGINPLEDQGIGGIHHLAFYVETHEDLMEIQEKIEEKNMITSGILPREFFDATYFREPNGLLFEVATKTRPVPSVEDTATIDELPLYLPDFLEPQRPRIEEELTNIDRYRKER